MEKNSQISIQLSKKATNDIIVAVKYIEQNGYPETAKKYEDRLQLFVLSLSFMPEKYAICRQKRFSRWEYRCAVFENTYIIVYKLKQNTLFVSRILHGKIIK